jgi:LysR family transcriptional regulator, glycine cleavage system transcriptional activator
MKERMPPMNALRVVEAAGRHVSFTRAAEELHVTPGAVSRQVKLLETVLGIDVFERNSRELRLTPESKVYIDALTEAFERISRATRRFVHSSITQPLHVHCTMTFALRWLVPRLASFHTIYPRRNVRMTTAVIPVTLQMETGDIDVMIEFGNGDWPNLVAHRLVDSELLPVCSPRIAAGLDLKAGIDGLANQTLLHSLARPDDWARWQAASGSIGFDPYSGIRFESSTLAYQAALEGIGVAIAQRCLVEEDLRVGRLVEPFDFSFRDGNGYYLVHKKDDTDEARLTEFRDWLLDTVAAERSRHNQAPTATWSSAGRSSTTPRATRAATSSGV